MGVSFNLIKPCSDNLGCVGVSGVADTIALFLNLKNHILVGL